MICKECQTQGLKSLVYINPGATTLSCPRSYYDEDGNYHLHDPNSTIYYLRCSKGHEWKMKDYNKCWCGWTNEQR